jgi:hypothetical protein
MSTRPPQEFDLFGDAIPTYDTKTFTPQWFAEMHTLIEAGRRCREHHAWLKSQAARWSPPTFEVLPNSYVRSTSWRD